MKEFYGKMTAPIWLIGDSAPKNAGNVRWPLDVRHPAVHNIWTPIMHNIQKKIYLEKSKIITAKDDEIFFIKNAALTIEQKEGTGRKSWGTNTALMKRLESTKNDIEKHNPQLVISFGAFAFEFMRRCYIQDEKKWHNMNNWTTKKLGEAFNENIAKNDPLIPLLHVSIYRYWHICSKVFTADTTTESPLYFEYVAERLYKRFIAVLNM